MKFLASGLMINSSVFQKKSLTYSVLMAISLASVSMVGCEKNTPSNAKTVSNEQTKTVTPSTTITSPTTNTLSTTSTTTMTAASATSVTVTSATSTTALTLNNNRPSHTNVDNLPNKTVAELRSDISQQFMGTDEISVRLAYVLPEIPYSTENLSSYALEVNQADWQAGKPLSRALTTKIQALLNWHGFGVGAVDGSFSQNTIKAMQTFQQANNLPISKTMDDATWQALTTDTTIASQPVLVNYTITKEDVKLPYHPKGMQFTSVKEALGEKFHMSRGLLTALNPKIPLKEGGVITVYNPYQPNTKPVSKVIANKRKNLLYAYDENDKLIASFPTTVGSKDTPSPQGTHHVRNRVIDPTYNSDFKNKDTILPPGPNNPVGRVWMGLSKKGYGIHGSPEPEMISRQGSHGCVRLTNWDALALFGTLQDNAEVVFQ